MAVWWDKETKDEAGALIHIAFARATTNVIRYVSFNTADDTYGTIQTVDNLTVSGSSGDSDVGICVAKSGRIYVCASGDLDAHTENTDHSMLSSDDSGASWDARTSPYSSDEELMRLLPGSAADTDDICAVVFDTINADLEFWKYDASAGTWGKSAIDTGILVTATEGRSLKGFFDAVSRHSDEHILVAYWNDFDQTTGDFRSVDITQATPTITQKTNIDNNTDDSFMAGLLINQQNDDVYVAYLGSDAGDEVQNDTVNCYFKLSTDDMGTWGTEQTYGAENDDLRMVSGGHTVANDGGRFMPAWSNVDLSDITVNDGNDVEIAAAGGVTTRRYTLTTLGVG